MPNNVFSRARDAMYQEADRDRLGKRLCRKDIMIGSLEFHKKFHP